jgi:mRNA-degrading endonuclease RelE of RelBE toxin-antitoxin system
VGREVGGRVWGTFGIALEMSLRKIRNKLKKKDQAKKKKWGSELNKEFSPEEYRKAEKHLKKCSTSLIIREMQIQTILRFHLTPVRMELEI